MPAFVGPAVKPVTCVSDDERAKATFAKVSDATNEVRKYIFADVSRQGGLKYEYQEDTLGYVLFYSQNAEVELNQVLPLRLEQLYFILEW